MGCLIALLVFVGMGLVISMIQGDGVQSLICLVACIGLVWAVVFVDRRKHRLVDQKQQWLQEIPDVEEHPFPTYEFNNTFPEIGAFAVYVTGFDSFAGGPVASKYVVTSTDYILYSSDMVFIGRIPRDGISGTEMMDQSQVTQKFDLGALLVMGPLGISQQKQVEHGKYYLVVHARDNSGQKLTIMFRAQSVDPFNKFLTYKKPFVAILAEDERKCLYCAEVIKAEAIKCRYCGSDLADGDSGLSNK